MLLQVIPPPPPPPPIQLPTQATGNTPFECTGCVSIDQQITIVFFIAVLIMFFKLKRNGARTSEINSQRIN